MEQSKNKKPLLICPSLPKTMVMLKALVASDSLSSPQCHTDISCEQSSPGTVQEGIGGSVAYFHLK